MVSGEIVPATAIVEVRTRFTVPANPFKAVTVTVELPVLPARMVMVEEFAATPKSTT